jgi:uncharacterized protein (DUF1330 family)
MRSCQVQPNSAGAELPAAKASLTPNQKTLSPMNRTKTLMLAAIAFALTVVFAVETTRAQARAPGYMIIEYEVTDQAEYREYLKASAALRATGAGGTFLVRGAKGIGLSGELPKTTAIIQFASVDEAIAFDKSPEYSALKANRDKALKWRSFVVEGMAR